MSATKTIKTSVIKPKDPKSKWVALAIFENDKIIAEGIEPDDVIEKAKKTGKEFSLMFVPKKGTTYIL